jgi:CrcB protein
MRNVLLVGIGGGLGAMLRYGVQQAFQSSGIVRFPWGTFLVNVSGSFLMGIAAAWFLRHEVSPSWRLFVTVGLLGGYTTFSAFAWEIYDLANRGAATHSLLYAGGSVIVGLAALLAGIAFARSLG